MDNTSKKCAQCGTLNQITSNFCVACGSNNFEPLETEKNDNTNTGNNGESIANVVGEQMQKATKPKEVNFVKIFLSGLAGVLAVIIAIVVIGKFPPKTPSDNADSTETVVSELTSTTPSKIEKTIMIYLVGSDLESQSGAASMDIVEMMESGVDTSKNNILVYTGGTKQWFIENIPATQNSIYKLENEEFSLVKSLDSLNMGESSTLSEFLNYGLTNYSADSYGLILWNHGAGPMIGYGVDEVHGDLLEMSEITAALSNAGFKNDSKLEFLGFDACLMGSIETASKRDSDGNELSIQLTEEQAANYAGSTYYIVKKMKDDEYLFIFSGVDAKLDENGVLSASYNDKAVFGINDSNGEVSDIPIIMYQVNDGSDELKYFATSIFFDSESLDISEWKTEAVEWQIKIDNGIPKLLGAMPIEDDNQVPNKQLLNYKDYTYVQFVFSARKPTYDNSGKLLPYFNWESTGMFYGTEYYVDDGFHLECRDIEDKDEYYAMFVVKDAQGNKYASELFTLDK